MEWAGILMGGVVATFFMTLSLYFIHWSGFANGDMVRALGSWITRRDENSFPIGLVFHFSAGAGFALLYYQAWRLTGFSGDALSVLICTLFGLFHGSVVSLMLVVLIAEHHPLERFREAGLRVAVTYIAAHVVYGFVVGVAVSMSDLQL